MRSPAQHFKTISIRGKQFDQETLSLLNLQDKAGGQQIFFKVILFVFVLLLCIITGGLAGYVGGAIGLYNSMEVAGSVAVRVATLIVITVLLTATFQDQHRSILVVIIALCLVMSCHRKFRSIISNRLFRGSI
jgi:Mn2+/Fe2+ NRAMP family transporter